MDMPILLSWSPQWTVHYIYAMHAWGGTTVDVLDSVHTLKQEAGFVELVMLSPSNSVIFTCLIMEQLIHSYTIHVANLHI